MRMISCGRGWALVALTAGLSVASGWAADWQPTTAELVKAEKPGFGGLCGVVVDHRTGAVTVNLSDRGFYRSADQGKTWGKLGSQVLKGRTEWPGCLMLDAVGDGKTLVSALVYGEPILVSGDGGTTYTPMDKKSSHVDWCAVDWTDPEMQFV